MSESKSSATAPETMSNATPDAPRSTPNSNTSTPASGASSGASSPDSTQTGGFARGTLAHASLPGAAFHPNEFDVDLSQTSLAEADELLKAMLDEAMNAVGGTRAFLALIDTHSGELVLRFTAGEGWTNEIRRLRVNVKENRSGKEAPAGKETRSAATSSAKASQPGSRQGITRHVVVNSRPYWTGDVSNDPYYVGFFDDVCSEVAVPIMAREGGTIGVINVESTELNAFTEEHAKLLAESARRVAIIIAMAEHQLREEALIAIGKDFNSAADLETLMQDVVEQATKILRADDCSLFLMEDEAGSSGAFGSSVLRLAASHGPLSDQVSARDVSYKPGEGLTGWVVEHGKVIRVGDPRTDARWKGLFMEAPVGEIAAVMAVPVLCQRSKPGVLRVIRHRKGSLYFLPQEFTQADEDVLVTLAGQLAVAIDRTRLIGRLLHAERMAAWGEMSARSAHMIGNTVFGIKGHLNELSYLLQSCQPSAFDNCETESTGATDAASSTPPIPRPLEEARNFVENITRGIYRLEEILGEFRDFVLATQLHTTENDINQILRNVTVESFPRHSNIDLVLNLTPNLPSISVDEAKLKRAFSELIENSIDFQPHGGMLTIRTSLADADAINSMSRDAAPAPRSGSPGGKAIQIEFIDHGPGLSEQDRERVFLPFYTRKAKGMGLGLSIVKGIIEAHRGAICEVGNSSSRAGGNSAGSKPAGEQGGEGAHFIILLPVLPHTTAI